MRRRLRQAAHWLFRSLPIWFLLGLGRLSVRLHCWGLILRLTGHDSTPHRRVPALAPEQARRASRIGQQVRQVARRTPWVSDCLPQALAASALLALNRIPSCVFIGVRRGTGGDDFVAHAWVMADRVPVSGGSDFDGYQVLGCFVSRGHR